MPKEPSKAEISRVMREMGRKGGSAQVPKGTAALSQDERKARAKAAAEKRWGKKKSES